MDSVRIATRFFRRDERAWVIVAMIVAGLLFLSTIQVVVNGSESPYATDVGEIQNALPRWGTIHWTGYPLYTGLGSLFVTVLRWVGVPPAAGTSLFSALWGVSAVGLLVALLQELDVPGPLAALGALVATVSLSVWMDASLAEVHTMTMALTLATLLYAVRFGRLGERRDFLLLILFSSQGVAHQRAVMFLAPAVVVLVLRQWREMWRGLVPALLLSLLAPLTYLYLPWRVQQGTTWVFGTPGTWQRVMTMLLDNRAERIVSWPVGVSEWGDRLMRAFAVTGDDLSSVLLVVGLLGLLAPAMEKRWREAVGLTLGWVPYLLLTGVIWIGRVGDAQLAAHLPITVLAAAGLAQLAAPSVRRTKWGRSVAMLILVGSVLFLIVRNRPRVLEVTRDASAEAVIATVEQVAPPPDACPTTFMALWGNDYWALAYAQAFEGRLPGLDIVDHNASFKTILASGNRLFTLSKTFYRRPVSWWDAYLGPIHLSSVAPEIIEIAREPPVSQADVGPGPVLDLGDGLWIRSAQTSLQEDDDLILTVYWQAEREPVRDYSVAVHLVAHDPPRGPEDIVAQADSSHPVYGWYPTSRWSSGEIVRDDYRIALPEVVGDVQPRALRVALYYVNDAGEFVNSPWLSVPIEDQD
jgi:hypothetical protein